MANTIFFNDVRENLTIRKWKFHLGIGDVGKGPTNLTGFFHGWHGAHPYVIYLRQLNNLFPTDRGDLAFIGAYNGSSYSFGANTNLQQVSHTSNSSPSPPNATYGTKVSRINSGVAQRDYVQIELTLPAYATRILSFWYYGTYGSQIQVYNNDMSANLSYLDSSKNWVEGSTSGFRYVTIPVTINVWQKIVVRIVNNGTVGTGLEWIILHNDVATTTLANTEYWIFSGLEWEEKTFWHWRGPAIYPCANDEELIQRTNQIDRTGTKTTAAQCLEYFAGQSDKMVVNRDLEPVSTNGLKFYVDAGYLPSYPKSGNTWYDLGFSQSNGTLQNGVVYSTDVGGSMVFDGTNARVYFGTGINFYPLAQFTIEIWFKSTGTVPTTGVYPELFGFDYGINARIGSAGILYYVHNGSEFVYLTAPGNFQNSVWTCGTFFHSGSTMGIYINGVFATSRSATWQGQSQWPTANQWVIGQGNNDSNNYFVGSISSLRIYNRVLTAQEILQNCYGGLIVTSGLVFYLDPANIICYANTSNVAYSFIGGYTASLEGGITFLKTNSGVFDLDGQDEFIEMPHNNYWNSNVFGTATNFTIECWYKPDVLKNWDSIIWKQNTSVGGFYSSPEGASIWSDVSGFVAVFASGVASNPAGSLVQIFYTTSTLKWYHLCFTGDGTTLSFYVDGIQRGTALVASRTVAVTTSSNGPSFGKRAFMNGQLGNIKFYTRHLTAWEVLQNFEVHRSRYGI